MESVISSMRDAFYGFPVKIISLGSILSIPSLLSALLIAILFLVFRRGLRKQTRFGALIRILFPSRIWLSPSTFQDMKYVLANSFLYVAIVPLAVSNFIMVQHAVSSGLELIFGPPQNTALPEAVCIAIVTFLLFIAYEIAYWTDHYLSHKVPFLWEFHKVHHSATVLTPFTNWRVHPVDTIVFFNFIAFFSAVAHGVTNYALNKEYTPFTIAGSNVIILVYFYLYGHLQHSQIWMTFGRLGRIFISPAHHQIHHSTNPVHFDKNFGGSLAVFDWLFGTLYMPPAKKANLSFGVGNDPRLQGFLFSTVSPFYYAGRHVYRACRKYCLKYASPK